MKYALIENGIVINIVMLLPFTAKDFSNAVRIEDLPVQIGDTYTDGRFYHEGKPIYSMEEQIADMKAALTRLGYSDNSEVSE